MKPSQIAKNAAKLTWDTFEDVAFEKTTKPIWQETINELGGFFGAPRLGTRPKSLAQEDLARARQEQDLKQKNEEDDQKSKEAAQRYIAALKSEYKTQETRSNKDQQPLKQEVAELQSEIVKLAKAAGVDTKVHLEQMTKKIGVLDIKRLTAIVRTLRMKADEAKSGQELVSQRSNAKRTTGMLAWVSGKQMKVHEQGTLQLQG